MRPPMGSSTIAYFSAVRGLYMKSDFQRKNRNYPFVPELGVNPPLQEVNTE